MDTTSLAGIAPALLEALRALLANRENRAGLAFVTAACFLSLGFLEPRSRKRERAIADARTRVDAPLPHEYVTEEDLEFVRITKALAKRTPHPIHSGFLVAACISYWDRDRSVRHVLGVNSETCVLPSAICAERCALLQVREAIHRDSRDDYPCDPPRSHACPPHYDAAPTATLWVPCDPDGVHNDFRPPQCPHLARPAVP
jgi:hypothetical protein